MRLHFCVVGRLRASPEKQLIDDYLERFDRTGRALGLGPCKVIEVEDKKNAGMAAEADLLRKAIPKGAVICTLDERGKLLTSPDFSKRLADWRDTGRQDVAFVIGGADGSIPACVLRQIFPSLWARWSGRICWLGSCWQSRSIAPRRSWQAVPITGSDSCLALLA